MGQIIKEYAWKSLGILLLAYTLWMNFTVEIKPGLAGIDPIVVSPGIQELNFYAYNGHLSENTAYYLCNDSGDVYVQAHKSKTVGEQQARVWFDIPDTCDIQSLDAIYVNEQDGTCILPSAVFVTSAIGPFKAEKRLVKTEAKAGFAFPFKSMLYETIRNLNFHVTMWFALLFCMAYSVFQSVIQLRKQSVLADLKALNGVKVGLFFALAGLISGSIWARFTWGAWWVNDTKLNGAALSVLVYLSYLLLRQSVNEDQKKARLAAVYNIFAFVMMIVFIQILPRMTDSLHPGNGGNPAFSQYDLDNKLRMVFYPAVLGWILLSAWFIQIQNRLSVLTLNKSPHEK